MRPYLNDGMQLYLGALGGWGDYFRLRRGPDVDAERERAALGDVLETAARVCAQLETSCRPAWLRAPRLEDGRVVHAEHMRRAYERLCAAGLVGLYVDEAYGGPGLPAIVTNAVMEMLGRADASLMTLVGLQTGVAEDVQTYASDALKRAYLPRFATGELMGAMVITEPGAGSDLGGIRTRAVERDGGIALEGEKIFITNGGCDVHLVLARDDDTFEASQGTTRGLSLYLCPRALEGGRANAVEVVRLEEKVGNHGAPTAAVAFRGARAERIGAKGEGFRAMLSLMNGARLGVAAQAVGIGEAAIAAALRFAEERVQFGAPISGQPLLRGMLARIVVDVEACRALLYRTCRALDRQRALDAALARAGDQPGRAEAEAARERSQLEVRLMTPLAKYLASETAVRVTRQAVQVHGGVGYMAEAEVAKLHSDAIVTTIYEGTSEIQASFALREMAKGSLDAALDGIGAELDALPAGGGDPGGTLRATAARLRDTGKALVADPAEALLHAPSLAEGLAGALAGAELLAQAGVAPVRSALAADWIDRLAADVDGWTRRVHGGSTPQLPRCDAILAHARGGA